jgi:hypothetical protein
MTGITTMVLKIEETLGAAADSSQTTLLKHEALGFAEAAVLIVMQLLAYLLKCLVLEYLDRLQSIQRRQFMVLNP